MKTKILLLLGLCLLATGMHATDLDSLVAAKQARREPLPRWAFSFKFGMAAGDEGSTSYELGAEWYPLRYVGVGLGLELDDNHGNKGWLNDMLSSKDDRYDYDPDRVIRFNFHPMVSLRTPVWYFSKKKDWGLMLQCKPGMVISLPQNDVMYVDHVMGIGPGGIAITQTQRWQNRDGGLLAWRVLSTVSVGNSQGAFSVGWSVSNYNIMSCRNNLYYQGKRVGGEPSSSLTHALVLQISMFL